MKTYKQQFDLLTAAYINGDVNPYDCKACFIGNLLQGALWAIAHYRNKHWVGTTKLFGDGIKFIEKRGYSYDETTAMEENFLKIIAENTGGGDPLHAGGQEIQSQPDGSFKIISINRREKHSNYEDALFKAFESTLEMLRKIHESKGDFSANETPAFTKRVLKTA